MPPEVHVGHPRGWVETTQAHLVEADRLHGFGVLGTPGHRVQTHLRVGLAVEDPDLVTFRGLLHVRRPIGQLRRHATLEEVGRLDDVVVDRDQRHGHLGAAISGRSGSCAGGGPVWIPGRTAGRHEIEVAAAACVGPARDRVRSGAPVRAHRPAADPSGSSPAAARAQNAEPSAAPLGSATSRPAVPVASARACIQAGPADPPPVATMRLAAAAGQQPGQVQVASDRESRRLVHGAPHRSRAPGPPTGRRSRPRRSASCRGTRSPRTCGTNTGTSSGRQRPPSGAEQDPARPSPWRSHLRWTGRPMSVLPWRGVGHRPEARRLLPLGDAPPR